MENGTPKMTITLLQDECSKLLEKRKGLRIKAHGQSIYINPDLISIEEAYYHLEHCKKINQEPGKMF